MAEQTPEYNSREWWRDRLVASLEQRRQRLNVFEDYYCGRHPLLFATEKFRKAFGLTLHELADNWMELIIAAVGERLNVEGFRLGESPKGDPAAWRIWQRNGLDAESEIGHTEALINGCAYGLAWWDEDNVEQASITVEHPYQMIVAASPANPRKRVAALKKWQDDEGYLNATLYLPAEISKWRSRVKASDGGGKTTWEARQVVDEPWPLENKLGVVPVVPLVNHPRLLRRDGESELARAIPIQNAINKLVCDLLVGSEFYAFRARWATGLEIPEDPETGQEIDTLKMAFDRVWTSKDPKAQFGEFGQSDLGNWVKSIEMFVQHMASQTATPPHRFYLGGQFPSGEALKSAESGLVAKARRRARHYGEGWEEIMRLAFLIEGQDELAVTNSETIWGDFETRSETAHADYLVKLKALNVPDAQLWEDAGYSPTQIARFPELRAIADAEFTPPPDEGAPSTNGSKPGAASVAGG